MLSIRTHRSRRLAALLLAVVAGTAMGVPWLHADAPVAAGPVVQERHDPGTCVPLHDHGICVQYQHARSLGATRSPAMVVLGLAWISRPVSQDRVPTGSAVLRPLPRAPPLS